MFHIYYRISNFEKPEVRTEYFSKYLVLKNFLFGLSHVEDWKLSIVYNGKPEKNIAALGNQFGTIEVLEKLGNSGSFWHTFSRAIRENDDDDLIYFVEDDYIHTPKAFEKLLECNEDIEEADYITLYDHPVRYASNYHFGLDLPHWDTRIYLSRSHHWRTQESTCMTFASTVKTLSEDQEIFERYVVRRDAPEDRELFRRLQGLVGYEKGSPKRRLLGPIPSLATHCHEPWLAPNIDWEKLFYETTS